jgi:hypothetical protein
MVEQYEYYDEDFDNALVSMLGEARESGAESRRITAKELHASVVTSRKMYMRMTCDAMWKLWKKQGSYESRVVYTPASNQGSKLEIEYESS